MPWGDEVYASLAELKSFREIADTDTADDAFLAITVAAASRSIDDLTDNQFGVVAAVEARVYPVQWDYRDGLWVAEIDDLLDSTGLVVTVDSAPLASTEYRLEPRNAPQRGDAWTELATESASRPAIGHGSREVEVTALWGWPTVPDAIKQATLLQANRLTVRRDSPHGVAGSPELGNELRMLAKADPDAEALAKIGRYSRSRGFA